MCEPGCGASGCIDPMVCDQRTGRCVDPANAGGSPLGAACTRSSSCASTSCFDLGSGLGSRCVTTCGSSDDCPPSFTCHQQQGANACVSATLIGSGATLAGGDGTACTDPGSCHSDFCAQGKCTPSCTTQQDCGTQPCTYFAEEGAPLCLSSMTGHAPVGASCQSGADCESGVCLALATSSCVSLCATTRDCPDDSVCGLLNFSTCAAPDQSGGCMRFDVKVVKACVREPHGASVIGATCMAHSDCRSGFCHPQLGQCTDLCSTNAQCPSTHRCKVELYTRLSSGDAVYADYCFPIAGG
jgi:hypothetical protein